MNGSNGTEVEDIDVVLGCQLKVGQGAHLHDWSTGADREGGVGRLVGHQGSRDTERRSWNQAKTEGTKEREREGGREGGKERKHAMR